MKKPTEKQFQKTVVQYARLMGWRVVHVPKTTLHRKGKKVHLTAVSYDGAGFPDLLLVRGNRIVFAELKVPPNTTTPEQDAWIASLRAAGQVVYVWYPTDWKTIEVVFGPLNV